MPSVSSFAEKHAAKLQIIEQNIKEKKNYFLFSSHFLCACPEIEYNYCISAAGKKIPHSPKVKYGKICLNFIVNLIIPRPGTCR